MGCCTERNYLTLKPKSETIGYLVLGHGQLDDVPIPCGRNSALVSSYFWWIKLKTELLQNCSFSFLLLPFLSSDKQFPAFGFGAQVPPSWQVGRSQCWVLALSMSAFLNCLSHFPRYLMILLWTSTPATLIAKMIMPLSGGDVWSAVFISQLVEIKCSTKTWGKYSFTLTLMLTKADVCWCRQAP